MRAIWVPALLAILAVCGCTTARPLGASSAAASPSLSNYQLGPGDKFRMTVFNEPTLTGLEYQVGADGTASLPLIGSIKIADLTARQAEQAITARYAEGYLGDPRINIEITAYRPFYILGEVNKPGQYAFVPGLTVLKAAALAEGLTYRASTKRVFIRHSSEGAEQEVQLNADTPVLPGDTVRVAERFF